MADLSRATSRSLSALVGETRPRAEAALATVRGWGHDPYVFETKRSTDRQTWLYQRNLSKLMGAAGLHTQGYALDVVDGRTVHGYKVLWGDSLDSWGLTAQQKADRKKAAKEFFDAWGRAVKAAGLEWGGDWSSFGANGDGAHAQLPAALRGAVQQAGAAGGEAAGGAARYVSSTALTALSVGRPWWHWALIGGGAFAAALVGFLALRRRRRPAY